MHSQIKQIETIAKLPGYLFVLTVIADINEKIFLSCPKDDYEFISSMLNLIGLRAYSLKKDNTNEDKLLFMLNNLCELDNIIPAEGKQQCFIIYVNNGTFSRDDLNKAEHFLREYPQCIIITNIALAVSTKRFCININQNNQYYEKLQKNISVFGNSYGIQEPAI